MLIVAGARRRTASAAGGAADPDLPVPYTMPTAAPWNAPQPMVTPSYTGGGQSAHPSIVDFWAMHGIPSWRGWRYWLAHTPYDGGDDNYENPAILVSNNGHQWQKPAGVRDPIYPAPPTGFSSDTHLAYDPDADRLLMLHRTTLDRVNHTVYITGSPDGVTWPETPTDSQIPQNVQPLSPSLVRAAAGDWRLFALRRDNRVMQMWTATTPDGPWAGPVDTVGASRADGFWGWHLDVQYHSGQFWGLVDRGPLYLGNPDGYRAITSSDGLSWSTAGDLMTKSVAGWDNAQLYRAATQPHEDGASHRLWYSAQGDVAGVQVWHTGYTIVPRSLWPTPLPVPVAGSGTGYGATVTPDAPSVWWRMDAAPSAAVEVDTSGNGRSGSYVGGHVRASSLSGDVGYSTRIGFGGHLLREHEAWMEQPAFTAEAIVQQAGTNGHQTIVSLWGATAGWTLEIFLGQLRWEHSSGVVVAAGGITAGTAYHVAVTVDDAGVVTLYRNGASVASGTVTMGAAPTDARMVAGARVTPSLGSLLDGMLDEVAYYPAALPAARVLAHAQAAGLA